MTGSYAIRRHSGIRKGSGEAFRRSSELLQPCTYSGDDDELHAFDCRSDGIPRPLCVFSCIRHSIASHYNQSKRGRTSTTFDTVLTHLICVGHGWAAPGVGRRQRHGYSAGAPGLAATCAPERLAGTVRGIFGYQYSVIMHFSRQICIHLIQFRDRWHPFVTQCECVQNLDSELL